MKLLLLATMFFSLNAIAWGPIGHRVVGEVAQKHLTTEVQLKVFRTLGGQSLARVANWPDDIKSDHAYDHTHSWHYTEWGDNVSEYDENSSDGKIIKVIREQVAVLKDVAATPDKKAFAIKFITHLVGDLHQPLHVGNGLDQGGNLCKVTFHGKVTTLHRLWDEELIEQTRLSFSELAQFIAQGKSKEEIVAWKSGDVLDWALESKEIRDSLYPAEVNAGSRPLGIKNYCRKDVPANEMPKLAYDYSYKQVPLMEKRLFQAGLRLAHILNEALK